MRRPVPAWCLLVALAVGAAAGGGAGWVWGTRPPRADAELATARQARQAGEYQAAYDALLAAMRVAPQDEAVFAEALAFARDAGGKTADGEAVDLAEDVHRRAEGLLPYLPLAKLTEARAVHTKVGDELFRPGHDGKPAGPPFGGVDELLAAAADPATPVAVRARLLVDAEAELAAEAARVAAAGSAAEKKAAWPRLADARVRLEARQKEVLALTYTEAVRPRVRAWQKDADEFSVRRAEVPAEELPAASAEALALIARGQRLARDLAPYLDAELPEAEADLKDVKLEKRLTTLARFREWNYNRWALAQMDSVEQSPADRLSRLGGLAEIDDGRLVAFARERYAELWAKLFNDASTDEKVRATRLRTLGGEEGKK